MNESAPDGFDAPMRERERRGRTMTAAGFAVVFAAATAAATWKLATPGARPLIQEARSGGCENPPPGQGCDPWTEPAVFGEPRGYGPLLGAAGGALVLGWIGAYLVLERRPRRHREAKQVPAARVV